MLDNPKEELREQVFKKKGVNSVRRNWVNETQD